MASKERWAKVAEDKDFAAAAKYLSLLADGRSLSAIVRALRRAPVVKHRANDVLRASSLSLLPIDDPEVAKDLKKARKGQLLAVVLLVRGRVEDGDPLVVADGYHRVCASYHLDEDADIPCRITDLGKA
jgi:hypothetical protein